jgi:hypothetical protein
MKQVSERTASVLIQLVAWELLSEGSTVDPKALLRSLPIEDIMAIRGNIAEEPRCLELTTAQMVDLEVQYRTGTLAEDWSYERNNQLVRLHYTPIHSSLLRNPRQLEA